MIKEGLITALIAAAGQGKRMKSDVNKQYLNINDKPILVHTLEMFDKSQIIDDIILIVKKDEIDFCKKEIINKYKFNKTIKIVSGGKERQESIYNGLKAANKKTKVVVTHDGARPFVTLDIIEKSIYEAIKYKAVGVGVPVKDTIKVIDNDNYIIDTPNRSKLWKIQTPQTFLYNILLRAHEIALHDGFLGTDDSVLVERIGVKVKMIKGSYENIKITTPEDMILGDAILKSRRSNKEKI